MTKTEAELRTIARANGKAERERSRRRFISSVIESTVLESKDKIVMLDLIYSTLIQKKLDKKAKLIINLEKEIDWYSGYVNGRNP
jgi:hypothetical protein